MILVILLIVIIIIIIINNIINVNNDIIIIETLAMGFGSSKAQRIDKISFFSKDCPPIASFANSTQIS